MSSLKNKKLPPPSGIITLLTDFGAADGYVAAMKGVILGIHRAAQIVDLTHEIAPQNIAAGAFLLSAQFKYFPPGTVHVAVVDPGVGTARKAIACYWEEHYFVAPENGLLDFCAEEGSCLAVHLTQREYWRAEVSNTFHGRDIFAPVAAHLAGGVPFGNLGMPIQLTPRLRASKCRVTSDTLMGEIIHCDRFGNLITNISNTEFENFVGKSSFAIQLKQICITAITPSYGYAAPGELVALFNSFDRLELGLVQGDARTSLAVAPGTSIIIKRGS